MHLKKKDKKRRAQTMNDQTTLKHLIQVMMILTKGDYTIKDISTHTGINTRSIYRYIGTLRESGFVINKNGSRYHMQQMPKELKKISDLLYFNEEEQFLLYSAIDSIHTANQIKASLKKKLYSIYDNNILPKPLIAKSYGDNLHNLSQAIQQHHTVTLIQYHSSHSNTVMNREVEPYAIGENNNEVWCVDLRDLQVKTFLITRMGQVKISNHNWQYESLHQSIHTDIFRMSSSESIPVTLHMSMRAANLLKEEYPLAEKYLSVLPDHRFELRTNVCNMQGIGRFVMGLLPEIRIIDSPLLEQYIHEQIKHYTRGVQTSLML